MTIDYDSEAIFSVPAADLVACAKRDGMLWWVLNYAENWIWDHSMTRETLSVLIEVYRALGCYANCWFLCEKYAPEECGRVLGPQQADPGLGLDLPVSIDRYHWSAEQARGDGPWDNRDLALKVVRSQPQDLFWWLYLYDAYIETEQLLMAVWTLLVAKQNGTGKAWSALSSRWDDLVSSLRVRGTCEGLWSFLGRDEIFLGYLTQILAGNWSKAELAAEVARMFALCFSVHLKPEDLLRPFAWPPMD